MIVVVDVGPCRGLGGDSRAETRTNALPVNKGTGLFIQFRKTGNVRGVPQSEEWKEGDFKGRSHISWFEKEEERGEGEGGGKGGK